MRSCATESSLIKLVWCKANRVSENLCTLSTHLWAMFRRIQTLWETWVAHATASIDSMTSLIDRPMVCHGKSLRKTMKSLKRCRIPNAIQEASYRHRKLRMGAKKDFSRRRKASSKTRVSLAKSLIVGWETLMDRGLQRLRDRAYRNTWRAWKIQTISRTAFSTL